MNRVKQLYMNGIALLLFLIFLIPSSSFGIDTNVIKVATAAIEIINDDSMAVGGGIFARYVKGQEGKLRATALIIEGNAKICIVACDVIGLTRDILDDACKKIEAQEGIPFDNVFITASHTHSAPTTVTVHGYKRDEVFCKRAKDAIVSAVHAANEKLKTAGTAELFFAVGQENTVGQNSRYLLSDGTIFWTGTKDDIVRPTGPFDPELPVFAFKQPDGKLEALMFNHSTHNMGTRSNKRSPAFYGLAAQELEQELGGTTLFLEGAAGSTHDYSSISVDERIIRIKNAVKEAFSEVEKKDVSRLVSIKKEFNFSIRTFDEAKEEKAVSYYCNKRMGGNRTAEDVIGVFRNMRQELAKHQGEIRKSWLHVILIGDIALVGVPGEFFTKLGMEIKRRSPFRYTYIAELTDDYIGYIFDKKAYELGGYQVWMGLHSYVSPETGEAIVDNVVHILDELSKK